MKLLKVSLSIGEKISKITITEFECTETTKSYKLAGRLLPKDRLMSIDSQTHNISPQSQFYHTWCLEGDAEIAKNMLIEHVRAKIAVFEKQINDLKLSFDKL